MKIKKAALLLVAVLMALAATAPAPAASAYCEGSCFGNEGIYNCPWTMSAEECCQFNRWVCRFAFTGVCYGDTELSCG